MVMKAIGIVLVVLGLVGLLIGGISWTNRDTVIDAGPLQVQTEKRERLPIPPVAGGILLVAGVVLLMKK
jgi:uncharacterized membrane protein YidH (DUF202 family)